MSDTLSSPAPPVSDPAEEVFAWFRTMRAQAPVYRGTALTDRASVQHELWHAFSHADVTRVLSDPATFSSDDRDFNPPNADIDMFGRGNIVSMDPPLHRKLRRLVNQVFTPRVVAGMEDRIAAITTELLDRVRGEDRIDLVDVLAYPLPVTVIAELLGIPAADMPLFRRWADGLFDMEDITSETLPSEEMNARVAPIMRELNEYLLAHLRMRRTRPSDDLLGRLTAAEVDGERLQDGEIVGFAGLLLLAGHITTTALLGNSVLCLGRSPDTAAEVRADRNLIPPAVEEVLRFRSPFPRLGRVTTTDVNLGGQDIPAGSLVIPWVGAANRDPARYVEPDRFDIHRADAGHLAFGHGIHFCIGAPLARLESRVGLGLLLDRYRDITVDWPEVEYQNPWVMVAARQLPLHVTA